MFPNKLLIVLLLSITFTSNCITMSAISSNDKIFDRKTVIIYNMSEPIIVRNIRAKLLYNEMLSSQALLPLPSYVFMRPILMGVPIKLVYGMFYDRSVKFIGHYEHFQCRRSYVGQRRMYTIASMESYTNIMCNDQKICNNVDHMGKGFCDFHEICRQHFCDSNDEL